MASEFFGRQRECRFYTYSWLWKQNGGQYDWACAVNKLGGPVIPGSPSCVCPTVSFLMCCLLPGIDVKYYLPLVSPVVFVLTETLLCGFISSP